MPSDVENILDSHHFVCGLNRHHQAISVLWDDHDPTRCGRVYYTIKGTAGSRRLIVTWYQVCHYGGATNDVVTFQVQLQEGSGKISMFYPYAARAISHR
jgi:hypothetical protein